MVRGSSWAVDDITVAADAFANGESVYQVAKEHGWPPARHPSKIFFSPQLRDLIDIREGQHERVIQEGQNGMSTGTCEHRHDDL